MLPSADTYDDPPPSCWLCYHCQWSFSLCTRLILHGTLKYTLPLRQCFNLFIGHSLAGLFFCRHFQVLWTHATLSLDFHLFKWCLITMLVNFIQRVWWLIDCWLAGANVCHTEIRKKLKCSMQSFGKQGHQRERPLTYCSKKALLKG